MSLVLGLRCRDCRKERAKEPVPARGDCWGALEPVYDLERVRLSFTREATSALSAPAAAA